MTWREAADILGQYDVNFHYSSEEHEGEAIPGNVLIEAFEKARRALNITEWVEGMMMNVYENTRIEK